MSIDISDCYKGNIFQRLTPGKLKRNHNPNFPEYNQSNPKYTNLNRNEHKQTKNSWKL